MLLLRIRNHYRGSGRLRPRGWQCARGDRGSVRTVENAHTRPTRRCPLRLRSTTIRVPRNVRPAVRRACVLLPSGVAVRPVGRWWLWRGGNRIYRARGSCAAASPRTRLHPTTRRRNITGDRVAAAAAVVVPSSPRQLRRRRRRSRERRGPFLFTSPPQPPWYTIRSNTRFLH